MTVEVKADTGKCSAMERFLRSYCRTCARSCRQVDPGGLKQLESGFIVCGRYVQDAEVWEW